MLISHSHQFIFLHNPKVAGSSIRSVLEKYADQPSKRFLPRLLIKLGIKERPPYTHHLKARLVREQVPQLIYDSYFKFTFVRNPWDLQVSLYHYMLKNSFHHRHQLVKQMGNFEEYIEWKVNHDIKLQKDFICDAQGNVIVDFVGRYENLAADFQTICSTLNLSESLPHINQSPRSNYQQYYNERTQQLVEAAFKTDIDFFGYTFDRTAEIAGVCLAEKGLGS